MNRESRETLPGRLRPADLAGLLRSGPVVMGVLNITPDSFSDGGRYDGVEAAVREGARMASAGAAILDVGGESTRPGAQPVSLEDECARVLPVIAALRERLPRTWISVDTMKPAVMQAAAEAGADLINDVNALRAPGALEAAAASGLAVCLMHMQGEPRTMQQAPHYDDVLAEVRDFLQQRCAACVAAGIPAERILVDPGIGFGKAVAHNLALLANVGVLRDLGAGVLVGASRKSLFGKLLDLPVDARLPPGLAVAATAVWQGAAVIRTHDVPETVQAVRMAAALAAARVS